MTRSSDEMVMLQTIAGYDLNAYNSQDRLVPQYLESNLDPEIQSAIEPAIGVLVAAGAKTGDVALEMNTDRAVTFAEASAYHAEYIAKSP